MNNQTPRRPKTGIHRGRGETAATLDQSRAGEPSQPSGWRNSSWLQLFLVVLLGLVILPQQSDAISLPRIVGSMFHAAPEAKRPAPRSLVIRIVPLNDATKSIASVEQGHAIARDVRAQRKATVVRR